MYGFYTGTNRVYFTCNFYYAEYTFLRIKYICFTECVLIYFAANGTYQADENNERIPKAVSTNGYDGMQTSPKLSRMISGNYTRFTFCYSREVLMNVMCACALILNDACEGTH